MSAAIIKRLGSDDMGLSKYNSEGYYDPTAYEGLKGFEESMKVIKLNGPDGYIEMCLDEFFLVVMTRLKSYLS